MKSHQAARIPQNCIKLLHNETMFLANWLEKGRCVKHRAGLFRKS